MIAFDAKPHWERIYRERSPEEVSWYQQTPALSLALIRRSGVAKNQPIIDVGGGTSTLVDHLLAAGYRRVAVLDLSAQALAYCQRRLGTAAKRVEWYPADVTTFSPPHRFALWHDRAVFHILIEAETRRGYLESLQRALLPGGQVVIAAFGPDGPSQCSGLNVARYDAASLAAALGEGFTLLESVEETHLTPAGPPTLRLSPLRAGSARHAAAGPTAARVPRAPRATSASDHHAFQPAVPGSRLRERLQISGIHDVHRRGLHVRAHRGMALVGRLGHLLGRQMLKRQ